MKVSGRQISAFFAKVLKQGSSPFLLPEICDLVILSNLEVSFYSSTTQGPKDLGGHDSHL